MGVYYEERYVPPPKAVSTRRSTTVIAMTQGPPVAIDGANSNNKSPASIRNIDLNRANNDSNNNIVGEAGFFHVANISGDGSGDAFIITDYNKTMDKLLAPVKFSKKTALSDTGTNTPDAPVPAKHRPSSFFQQNSNIISQHNYSRESLQNVEKLNEFPSSYSGGEICIILVVIIAWCYALYALCQSWAWVSCPTGDPWRNRAKKNVKAKSVAISGENNENSYAKNQNVIDSQPVVPGIENRLPTVPESVSSGGVATASATSCSFSCNEAGSITTSSSDQVPELVARPQPHRRTAADWFIEREGPLARRPRGLSRVYVVSNEDETVIFDKPGRRLKDAIALKRRRNNFKNSSQASQSDSPALSSIASDLAEQPVSTALLGGSEKPESDTKITSEAPKTTGSRPQ